VLVSSPILAPDSARLLSFLPSKLLKNDKIPHQGLITIDPHETTPHKRFSYITPTTYRLSTHLSLPIHVRQCCPFCPMPTIPSTISQNQQIQLGLIRSEMHSNPSHVPKIVCKHFNDARLRMEALYDCNVQSQRGALRLYTVMICTICTIFANDHWFSCMNF